MIRVGFNARLLTDSTLRGWNRYTVNLLAHLPEAGVVPVLYSPHPIQQSHLDRLPKNSYELQIGGPRKIILWDQWWWPRQAKRDRIDVLHSTFNFGLPRYCSLPCVLTLHDAIDYVYYHKSYTLWKKLRLRYLLNEWMHRSSREAADRIITVSEHAKQDLVRVFGLRPEKISVTYEAADPGIRRTTPEATERVLKKHNITLPYFFYVGGWEQRKNLQFLLRALSEAKLNDHLLVLAGGKAEQKAEIEALAKSLGVEKRVHLLEWVEEQDLPALYTGALCFVYPSEYEGFGLQICEAMACGCPVAVANRTSLPEVVGEGGVCFDLESNSALVKILQAFASDEEYRSRLQKAGEQRSSQFAWKHCAAATAGIYQELCRRNG